LTNTPEDILKTYWGFSIFRPQQKEIIQSVLQGKDTIALLSTGGGKSICYQIPALAKDGIAIVITPLVALMKDQVAQLTQKGIKALCISSGISYKELDIVLDNCIYGNYKFLYLSPERLQQEIVRTRISQMPVNLIAIDEAHCISQWGHDFRPAYLQISRLRALVPDTPMIALTATATPAVLQDITEQLQLETPTLFKGSFNRSNLTYTILYTADKNALLIQHLQHTTQSALVYVRNRKATIQTSTLLNNRGIKTTYYHGGLSTDERQKNHNLWQTDQVKVMVCTNAFGMGIDKANVNQVIHTEIPDSIENYFQEAGRCGRNGQQATATLIYNDNDSIRLTNQFVNVIPDITFVKALYQHLNAYFQIAYGEGEQTSYPFNFSVFCKRYGLKTVMTYNALQLLERHGVINLSREFSNKATVAFKVTDVTLTFYLLKNPQCETIVKAVLRTYGGIFDQVTAIDYGILTNKTTLTVSEIHKLLLVLDQDDIIDYEHKSYDAEISFLVPREDDRTINHIAHHIKNYGQAKKKQVQFMMDFIKNTTVCRNIQLMHYFGESFKTACGNCDCCRNNDKTKTKVIPIKQAVLSALIEGEKTSQELNNLSFDAQEIILTLKLLLDQKRIIVTPSNTYKLI